MKKLSLLIFVLFITGCATTKYTYFTSGGKIFEGKGGTMVMVDGIEFWEHGEPPRKYTMIGIINDERIVPSTKANLKKEIANKAREVGGDAIIKPVSQDQISKYYPTGSVGVYSSGGHVASGVGASIAVPLDTNKSSFVVIKYLD